jgi:hypothetical protein
MPYFMLKIGDDHVVRRCGVVDVEGKHMGWARAVIHPEEAEKKDSSR